MQGESRPHYVRCHVPITSRHNPRHVLVTYAVTSPSLPRRVRCHVPSCPHHVPLLSVTSAVTSRWTCRAAVTSTSHSPSHPHHVPSHPCHVPVTSPSRPRLMFPVTSLRSRITSLSRPCHVLVTLPSHPRHVSRHVPRFCAQGGGCGTCESESDRPSVSPPLCRRPSVPSPCPLCPLSRPRHVPVTSPITSRPSVPSPVLQARLRSGATAAGAPLGIPNPLAAGHPGPHPGPRSLAVCPCLLPRDERCGTREEWRVPYLQHAAPSLAVSPCRLVAPSLRPSL